VVVLDPGLEGGGIYHCALCEWVKFEIHKQMITNRGKGSMVYGGSESHPRTHSPPKSLTWEYQSLIPSTATTIIKTNKKLYNLRL
jgi:hypothetical protein